MALPDETQDEAPSVAQDDPRGRAWPDAPDLDPAHVEAVLEGTRRWRMYLERRPTHEAVFADLVAAGLELGGMDVLVEHYRARAAAEPDASELAILHARLLEWGGDVDAARAALAAAGELDPEGLALSASLASQAGQVEEACALLERALARAPDPDTVERLLLALGDAQRRAGDYEAVRATLGRLGDTAPDDALLQREVAWRLVEAGDGEAARARLLRALDLAADPVHRVATLDELARLEEREQLGAEALAHLEELLTRLAVGHWMRPDVLARLVDLHHFGGSLEAWVSERRARLDEDTDGRLALDVARGLQALGRGTEALEVLRVAQAAHPGDETLERALLEAARGAADPEQRIVLLQERLERRPTDRALALELVRELSAAGRADAARRRLDELVADAHDPADLQRLALTLEDPDAARALLEGVAARRPEDPSPWIDLAHLHGRAVREALELRRTARESARAEEAEGAEAIEVPPVPYAALAALAEAATRGDALAEERARAEARLARAHAWAELGRDDEARALFGELGADPSSDPAVAEAALLALAELHLAKGDAAAARATLWDLAGARSGAERVRTLERWTQTFPDEAAAVAYLDASGEAGAADADDAGDVAPDDDDAGGPDRAPTPDPLRDVWARARLAGTFGLDVRALAALDRVLELDPEDLLALEERARTLLRLERVEEALAEQRELVARDPARRAVHLLEVSRSCQRLGRITEALAAVDGARRAAWDAPVLLREVARRLGALRRPALELEVRERLMQLEPERVENFEAAARLHLEAGRVELARARFLSAARTARRPEDRERLLKELHRALYWVERDTGERAARIAALRARVETNPYDREAPELLLSLLRNELRHAELGEVAELLLERRPDHLPWVLARCRARILTGDAAGVLADVDRLTAAGTPFPDLLESLSNELLRDVDGDVSRALGARTDDLLATLEQVPFAQPTLRGAGRQAATSDALLAELLAGHVEVHGLDGPGVLDLGLALRRSLRDPALEVAVLKGAMERRGPTVVLVHRLGLALHASGDDDGARACGRRLVEFGAPPVMVERFYESCEIREHLEADRAELVGSPDADEGVPGDPGPGAGGR